MPPDVVASRTRWLVRVAVALVVATLIATGALLYVALGWKQMDAACTAEGAAPSAAQGSSVEFGWTWTPLGFSCTWPGDVTVTKLWW
ncbi:MAG: hypothetical protein ACK4MD_02005 [Demequina sp.]